MNNNDYYNNYVPLVPFMPEDPRVGYGYVPYQVNTRYFDNINEAYISGTLFPDLVTPYLEFINSEV